MLYLNKDVVVAYKLSEDEKDLLNCKSTVITHLYQTQLLVRSQNQMEVQGNDRVYTRTHKQIEWPGLSKACKKRVSTCPSLQQAIQRS